VGATDTEAAEEDAAIEAEAGIGDTLMDEEILGCSKGCEAGAWGLASATVCCNTMV